MSKLSTPYCQISTLSFKAGLVAACVNGALELALALAVHHIPVSVDEADAATVAVEELLSAPLETAPLDEVLAEDEALELWLASALLTAESASLTLMLASSPVRSPYV